MVRSLQKTENLSIMESKVRLERKVIAYFGRRRRRRRFFFFGVAPAGIIRYPVRDGSDPGGVRVYIRNQNWAATAWTT